MDDKKEIQQKIDALDKKIQDARDDKKTYSQNEYEKEAEGDDPEALKSARAGSEFLASIFAATLIGYGIDAFFLTKPWGMIAFMMIGFVTAVYRANATMQENNEKTGND
ncbi:MAG: AtpZ/AtpI family protein [Alphaproteobacteria bacterium]